MARKKTSTNIAFSTIEQFYWFAYSISSISYSTWAERILLDPKIRKSAAIGAKARAVVVFDRAINGETLL